MTMYGTEIFFNTFVPELIFKKKILFFDSMQIYANYMKMSCSNELIFLQRLYETEEGGGKGGEEGWVGPQPLFTGAKMVILTIFSIFWLPL